MPDRVPSGTVAFLFTDVEGSTRLWEQDDERMADALAIHDEIVGSAIEQEGGYVFSTAGDAFAAAFASAAAAQRAARSIHEMLERQEWPTDERVRIRIGLHVGEAYERGGDYFGPTLNRTARIMSAAHGGQIVASAAFASVVGAHEMADLGQHRLKDLSSAEHLWQVNEGTFPALRTLDVARHNLPTVPDLLVGRAEDVARILDLMQSHALVSVLGPGGMGKTRVALEAAAESIAQFADGAWFIDLAPVDVDAVGQAVINQLGTLEKPGLTVIEAVVEFCRSRQLLLVLDNCEHVLDPVAELVSSLIAVAPDVRVLATTREAVGIGPEALFALRPLSSGADGGAVSLFLDRARGLGPERRWSSADIEVVAEICDRLDGMPLAIELAASRLRSISLEELRSRLETSMRSLRGPKRGTERHRTLEAAVRWSYDGLDSEERHLFEHLAVFRGGARLDALQDMVRSSDADETEAVLEELIQKSMVHAEIGAPATRYRLLEPLRQFGEDMLRQRGELDGLVDRHAAVFADWARQWMDDVWGDGSDLRPRLDADWGNVRAAVDWAIGQGSLDRATRLITAMGTAQWVWSRLEVGEWAKGVLALPGIDDHPNGPELASVLAERLWLLNDLDGFEVTLARAWDMQHADPANVWPAFHEAARACNMRGDRAAGAEIMNRVSPGDDRETAYTLWNSMSQGDRSWRHIEAFDELAARTSSTVIATMAKVLRSGLALGEGDVDAAIEAARTATELAQTLGSHFLTSAIAIPLGCSLGVTQTTSPDDLVLLRTTLTEQRQLGLETDQWLVLIGVSIAVHHLHDEPLAAVVQRGLVASAWNDPMFLGVIPAVLPDLPAPPADEDLTLNLVVDRALRILDELLSADASRPAAGPPPQGAD